MPHLSHFKEQMLGFLHLIQRLIQPKRPRTHRITIVESAYSKSDTSGTRMGASIGPCMGLEVARVMGWRHIDERVGDGTSAGQTTSSGLNDSFLVVSVSPGRDMAPDDRPENRPEDGLTVRVDDVCDLRDTQDLTQCLRAIMNELHPKKRAKTRGRR